jgi:DNA-binding SARP family transcriptional activator
MEADHMVKNELAEPEESTIDVRLFGGVRMFNGEREVVLGPKRTRRAFVALACRAPEPIERSELIDWVWDDPMERAEDELARIMAELRSELTKAGLEGVLLNKDRLCRLRIPAQSVDLQRFGSLLQRARGTDAHDHKAELIRTALEIAKGPLFAGTDGDKISKCRIDWEARRHEAELALIDADIERDRGGEHLVNLRRMFQEEPGDARIAGLNMLALHSAGRQQDALEIYALHRKERDLIGLQVSPTINKIQTLVLGSDRGVRLPVNTLAADAITPTGGADMPAATEPNDEQVNEGTRAWGNMPPAFGQIIQNAKNVQNFGNVDARGANFGPHFGAERQDDDD